MKTKYESLGRMRQIATSPQGIRRNNLALAEFWKEVMAHVETNGYLRGDDIAIFNEKKEMLKRFG